MSDTKAPPDADVIDVLKKSMWRGNQWMRKRFLMENVNRAQWRALGYRYPSWHQVKRCLAQMVDSGLVEYRLHERGHFKTHQYCFIDRPDFFTLNPPPS